MEMHIVSENLKNRKTSAEPIQAVLFDMDGTLVDSEPLWHEADKSWLRRKGIELTPDEWVHIVGKGGAAFVRELMAHKGLRGSFQDLLEEKNREFLKIAATESRAYPEMVAFAREMKRRGLPRAIASASSPAIIDTTLECIGETGLFDLRCSGDSVSESKPHPMLFQHTASLLGVPAENCLVIEDSQYGVEAGLRAGMTVVGVPHHIPGELEQLFSGAHVLFPGGMKDFSARLLLEQLEEAGLLQAAG
ncbi:hypothetical protein L21SP2_1981 [Salinispira pacifica]|uniref:Uncharacterized protein n=2 Tax=Salinispira pacifica TaxID=1307761 RepID=V5WHP6_9SPIO|nr:hypothetical protein L21SP2_1981 [Salinispira pacifica]